MVRVSRTLVGLVLVLSVVGCSPGVSPTPTQIASASPTVTPITPQPTTSSTQEPPLGTGGPYFAYFRALNGVEQFVMMDANGAGRKVTSLPSGLFDPLTYPGSAMRYVSPNGKWIAFYTGSAGVFGVKPTGQSFNLTLNLLDLSTGRSQPLTPLLSKDYPNNFVEAAKSIQLPDVTATELPDVLRDAFVTGIAQALAWSPDGHYLAFAGQMDGLSSDLYVYDTIQQSIRRLTHGPEELQWIDWSPDGKWILYGSSYWAGEGMTFDTYAAALDGSSLRYLSTSDLAEGVEQWRNNHMYFEYDDQNGPGTFGLRLVDIETGKKIDIWKGSFEDYRVDSTGRFVCVLAVSSYESPLKLSSPSSFVPAPYLIDLTTLIRTPISVALTQPAQFNIEPFGLDNEIFALVDQNPSLPIRFVSDSARLTASLVSGSRISVSPDQHYWAVASNQDLDVYAAANAQAPNFSVPLPGISTAELVWAPDSSGLFILSSTYIFHVNLADHQANLVETSHLVKTDQGIDLDPAFLWIKGQ